MSSNQVIRLKEFPQGVPDVSRDFEVCDIPEPADPAQNEVTVSLMSLSMDPFLRGRMTGMDTYVEGFKRGSAINGFAVGKVTKTKNKQYKVGDYITGLFPWQLRFTFDPTKSEMCRRIEKSSGDEDPKNVCPQLMTWVRSMRVVTKMPGVTPFMNYVARASKGGLETPGVIGNSFPLTYHSSVLGMPGLTAWLGLMKVCQPKAGETLFVSSASGAVGQLVGQIGKMKGLKVVGSAGTDAKCNHLKDVLKFDAVINYKTCGDMETALKAACPSGIDCYFDNVGGETLDAVLKVANVGARFAICGAISQYNAQEHDAYRYKNLHYVLLNSIRMEGLIVSRLVEQHGMFDALLDLCEGLATQKIKYNEDIVEGPLADAPKCFLRMLKGENFGKQQFKVRS